MKLYINRSNAAAMTNPMILTTLEQTLTLQLRGEERT